MLNPVEIAVGIDCHLIVPILHISLAEMVRCMTTCGIWGINDHELSS